MCATRHNHIQIFHSKKINNMKCIYSYSYGQNNMCKDLRVYLANNDEKITDDLPHFIVELFGHGHAITTSFGWTKKKVRDRLNNITL